MTSYKLFGDKKTDLNDRLDLQANDLEFRIGLVMAGAISAGAYTAGVMDFMIEAITTWEKAKQEGDPGIPTHKIRFDILTGASAGGMCAGIFASALRDYKPGVRGLAPDLDAQNVFYRSWVVEVNYEPMTYLVDLKEGEKPKSLLNVTGDEGLEGICDRALSVDTNVPWPSWLKDPLPIILSVNNLRGIPFNVSFSGQSGTANHKMTMHKDYVSFSLSAGDHSYLDSFKLNFNQSGNVGSWQTLGQCTLASGAFPAAFRPRELNVDASLYDRRLYAIPKADGKIEWRKIPPSWDGATPNPYDFWSVDGGTMNNEPFELARLALADSNGRNDRDDRTATRMLIMVDPFPSGAADVAYDAAHGELVGSIFRLLASWKNQARLKLSDADILINQSSSSRFVIAPTKKGDKGPLASGSLGAFGGLLDMTWRHHDYLLGRLNCQKFLLDYFVVDQTHKFMQNTPNAQLSGTKARIIPLVRGMDEIGAAVEGIDRPSNLPWPSPWNGDDTKQVRDKFYDRLKQVVYKQVDAIENLSGWKKWLIKKYLWIAIKLNKGKMLKLLEDNLTDYQLFQGE